MDSPAALKADLLTSIAACRRLRGVPVLLGVVQQFAQLVTGLVILLLLAMSNGLFQRGDDVHLQG